MDVLPGRLVIDARRGPTITVDTGEGIPVASEARRIHVRHFLLRTGETALFDGARTLSLEPA